MFTRPSPIYFNPRTPHGVRPVEIELENFGLVFQPTHPSRGATFCPWKTDFCIIISTHAPLTGCDLPANRYIRPYLDFNPRTPHGVRRRSDTVRPVRCNFNPRTPHGVRLAKARFPGPLLVISIHAPLTGCDVLADFGKGLSVDFNPRTPHGVRRCRFGFNSLAILISNHAPLTGCDVVTALTGATGALFQSTHPSRGATRLELLICK